MNLSLNKQMEGKIAMQCKNTGNHTPDWIFILWMGGTALVSYSLVYALRKPFTAAEFKGLMVAGMDYKIGKHHPAYRLRVRQAVRYQVHFGVETAKSIEIYYWFCRFVRSIVASVRIAAHTL